MYSLRPVVTRIPRFTRTAADPTMDYVIPSMSILDLTEGLALPTNLSKIRVGIGVQFQTIPYDDA